MNSLSREDLVKLIAIRKLVPAKRLTVGQVRIATFPPVIRPERQGNIDPDWLEPVCVSRTLNRMSIGYSH